MSPAPMCVFQLTTASGPGAGTGSRNGPSRWTGAPTEKHQRLIATCSFDGAAWTQRIPAPDRAAQLESGLAEMTAVLPRTARAILRTNLGIPLVVECDAIHQPGCKMWT